MTIPVLVLLAAAGHLQCFQCAIIMKSHNTVLTGDLQVLGKIYNKNLWHHIGDLQDNYDCRVQHCGGHGVCNSTGGCNCDIGYCGTNCSLGGSVTFVSQTRTSSTSLQMVFRDSTCQQLSIGDELRLVKGSCTNPARWLRSYSAPTLSGGQTTFTFDPTNIAVPYSVCYKLNGSDTYTTISNVSASSPACSSPTDYLCPSSGACAVDCSACGGYSLSDPKTTSRICSKMVQTLGEAVCTSAPMACGGCGAYGVPCSNFFNNITNDFGHSEYAGECATWVRLDQDYWIHKLIYYPRMSNLDRARKYFILFFNSSHPPEGTDSASIFRPKAFLTIEDFTSITGPTNHTAFGPVMARYVMVYRNASASEQMNFAELEIWGTPAT